MLSAATKKPASPLSQNILRQGAWLLLCLTILMVLAVRIRLCQLPLERDEGEYAYAGQLILQGIPPYKEAYNMKLPGTYVAYAAIMAVFRQTPTGIHLGVALVNAASIVLIFLLGRKLLDEIAGVVAAMSFALLSLSPSVLGLAGHATHFVVLFELAGLLVLLRACDRQSSEAGSLPVKTMPSGLEGGSKPGLLTPALSPFEGEREKGERPIQLSTSRLQLFSAGVLFGLAFLMKQHGIFFGLFAGLYLLWLRLIEPFLYPVPIPGGASSSSETRRLGFRPRAPGWAPKKARAPIAWAKMARECGSFAAGFIVPHLLSCLVLSWAGAFHQFVFWTITYAGQYAAAVPLANALEFLSSALNIAVGPNLLLWIIPGAGALMMWWDTRLNVNHRFFLTLLALFSLASVGVGFYFRPHYFITLLPALALLAGLAVSRAVHLLKHDRTIELFLAAPVLGLFLVALVWALVGNGSVWFGLSPPEAEMEIYHTTLFSEISALAHDLKTYSAPDAKIAVLGSEPEIYFYVRRHAAFGYLYTYPLMEKQPYALKMQEEMIAEIERARPEYVVYVEDDSSWLRTPDSQGRLFDWWTAYWAANLDLLKTIDISEELDAPGFVKPSEIPPATRHLLLFRRKPHMSR
jgi:hypothetical protein